MLIIIMSIATALMLSWFILLWRVSREDWIAAAYCKVLDNTATVMKLRKKEKSRREKLDRYRGIAAFGAGFFHKNIEKEAEKLELENDSIQKGDIKGISIFTMPGYVILREFDAIGRGAIHKGIMVKSYELYGKKHANNKTKQLLARLLSYPLIGLALTITLGVMLLASDNFTAGMAIMGVGSVLTLVLVYALYDELSDKVNKRREAISKQFPNVVSKLALLVTSGMIMDRAWKETAYSSEAELYLEMQLTADELDNLVSPEAAFSNFIIRCNTKETSKLASALLQNLSKGNAEIGRLLKNMAQEAWQERRRTAKRDAENANSKLMIPTMLLFIAILIMLMVPIAMNFSGL
ncbi:MAG: type II secretion system F family protein [Oscillospiraceae bacterium]|nr:type II secretion system F family protein [Oscillospiraceae bacterium]